MTRSTLVTVLLGALLVLPACRSDGGFGRRDSERSREDVARFVSERFHGDVDRTQRNVSDLGAFLGDELRMGIGRIHSTYALYLGDYAEYHRARVLDGGDDPE